MIYRKIIIFCLVTGLLATEATCEGATSLQEGSSPVLQDLPGNSPTDSNPPQTGQTASCNDFSNLNLSTPKKAVISFIDLFNVIMPVFQLADLQEICTRVVISSYQKECMSLLETRLGYVKSIAKNLKGAYFIPQSLNLVGETPMRYNAKWQEKLTFNDGTTKLTNMTMLVYLERSGGEWKVLQVE